jgi:hypothetical protein
MTNIARTVGAVERIKCVCQWVAWTSRELQRSYYHRYSNSAAGIIVEAVHISLFAG